MPQSWGTSKSGGHPIWIIRSSRMMTLLIHESFFTCHSPTSTVPVIARPPPYLSSHDLHRTCHCPTSTVPVIARLDRAIQKLASHAFRLRLYRGTPLYHPSHHRIYNPSPQLTSLQSQRFTTTPRLLRYFVPRNDRFSVLSITPHGHAEFISASLVLVY